MEDGFANSVIKHHVNKYRPYGDTESFVIKVGQLPGDFSESDCWIFNRIRIIYKPDGVIYSGPWWGK